MPIKPSQPADFASREDGAVAVIVALMLTVLLGFAALGVDVAALFHQRSALQRASDLAAMSAAAAPAQAEARALDGAERNGFDPTALQQVQPGRYLRNPALPRVARFQPLQAGAPGINAISVTLQEDAPLHFARILSDRDYVSLSRSALAVRTGAASFSLDSHIARLDDTSLQSALRGAFGADLHLSAAEAQVLAGVDVNLGRFINALNAGPEGGLRNPAALLDRRVGLDALLLAARQVVPDAPAAVLAGVAAGLPDQDISVAAVLGGIDTELGLTVTDFAAELDITGADLLRALVGSRQGQSNVEITAQVPGVLSNRTALAVGEPPARSGLIGIGETGVTLHRAAARLHSDIRLSPSVLPSLGTGVSAGEITLPVYAEAAGATATLEALDCRLQAPGDVAARFSTAATPLHPANGTALAALYLGTLPAEGFATGPIDPATLGFADILDLSITVDLPLLPDIVVEGITVQARGLLQVGGSQVASVEFTRAEIAAGQTTKRFASGRLVGTAAQSLLSPDRLELRLKPGQDAALSEAVRGIFDAALAALPAALLTGLAAPVDAVLDAGLEASGLRLGEGALTLEKHHCEVARLVR